MHEWLQHVTHAVANEPALGIVHLPACVHQHAQHGFEVVHLQLVVLQFQSPQPLGRFHRGAGVSFGVVYCPVLRMLGSAPFVTQRWKSLASFLLLRTMRAYTPDSEINTLSAMWYSRVGLGIGAH